MANNITAQEYLTKSETKLRSFKREWESFTSEVPDKLMSLIRSGIRPSVSSSRSGNQIGVTLNFESNMDAAKKYIEQVKEKMEKKSDEIKKQIMDIDNDLKGYVDEGVDSDLFAKLVKNLNDWISYIPKMSFKIKSDQTINFEISDEILAIKKKWDKVSAEEIRKKEAEKYGVALADLDKHKTYLDAKTQKSAAKTSAAMKKAEKAFASIKGYLDSADLEKACATSATELKAKEDEEARIKRELEEAKKREEAERLRKAVEAYEKEVAEINKAKAEYISSETSKIEKKYSDALSKLKSEYETSCSKNKDEAEKTTSEKARLEKELEDAGLFAFGKKKQLRLDIEALAEKIRQLTNAKNKLDADYESARKQEKSTYESSLRVIPMNAGKKFVLPKDPRK